MAADGKGRDASDWIVPCVFRVVVPMLVIVLVLGWVVTR